MYKVSVEIVNVYPHPNADSLDLVSIGDNQYVVEKGLYETGDKAVAVPKNSVLTNPILLDEWQEYLQGPDKNRVGSIVLRGQESEGIILREDILNFIVEKDINSFTVGEDISTVLGISKYVPEVPDNIKDSVEVYTGKPFTKDIKHDCKYASVYLDKFVEGELITITSKLHGTQVNVLWNYDEKDLSTSKPVRFSSKGLWDKGLVFKEDVDNVYIQGWQNVFKQPFSSVAFWEKLGEIKGSNIFESQVQIVGEVVGVTGGFSYGYTNPTMFIYSIYIDGIPVDLNQLRDLNINIVPELYRGSFNKDLVMKIANEFAQQAECPLDGKTLNEGVVISNGNRFIKVKNDKFMKKHGKDETN